MILLVFFNVIIIQLNSCVEFKPKFFTIFATDMKAFLLAGGFGTRLKPLTDEVPKCLIPINGIPLLSYWFKLFEENNVTEVLINLHHLQKKVIEFCSEYNGKVKIKLVYESELLGSAGTILANKDFIENEDSFLILYADNLTNVNLIELIVFYNIYEFPLTFGLFHSKNPSNCGIVDLDENGKIIDFEEKPQFPKNNLASSGIFVGRKNLFNFFDSKQTKFPYDFANDVMSKMIGQMDGKILDCYIRDIGTHEYLKVANEEVKRYFNFDS